MKHKNTGGWFCLAIFLAIAIIGITKQPTGSLRTTLLITEILVMIILIEGIFITPNKPPHIGIVTKFDKREWKTVRNNDGDKVSVIVYTTEGWSWFFLRRIFYKIILINNSKRVVDFDPQILTTPDNATTKVPGSLAYTLDPKHIINFLNLGGNDPFVVFEDLMHDIFEDKLRVWSRNPDDGPTTYKELLSSGPKAEKVIVQSLCDPDMVLTDDDVARISAGHGKWAINHFGIYLNRMNLKEMVPFGEVYEASLKLDDEIQERNAENYELETDMKKATYLKEQLRLSGKIVPIEECLNQIMEWKIQREANKLLTLGAFAKSFAQALKS